MAIYHYKLIEATGRPRTGVVDLPFENEVSAMAYLERQGGTVIFARMLPHLLGQILGLFFKLFEQRVKRIEMAEALANLGVMLGAGIPVISAIRDTFIDNTNQTLVRVGRDLVMRIESGSSLSEAANYHKAIFSDTVLFLMRLGEESGNLDHTIKDAAEHVRRIDRIIRDVRGALVYPAFVFVAIFGALGFWLYFVVPTMVDLFRSLAVDLPPLTVGLIAFSEFLEQHIGKFVFAIITIFVALMAAIKNLQPVRRSWHALLMKTPVVGNVLRAFNLAFISEYFSLLLRSGVDLLRSMEVMRNTVSNEIYKERLGRVRSTIVQGVSLRESFTQAQVFPAFVVRMIGVGEESGSLTDQLDYIAEEYRDRLSRIVAVMGKTIEPLAIMVGGGLFILMAVALFMPLYQLIGSIV